MIKKRLLFFLAMLVFLLPIISLAAEPAGEKATRPYFVTECIKEFNQSPMYEKRGGLARIFGWGKGALTDHGQNIDFVWFAYCDEYGYLQLLINQPFPKDYLRQAMAIKNLYGLKWKIRLWQASMLSSESQTFIGVSGEWLLYYDEVKDNGGKNRYEQAIDRMVSIFNKKLPSFKIELCEYLDQDVKISY